MSILKIGDTGTESKKLQTLLNSMLIPCPRLREDGNFGQRTQEAVVSFQKMKGLKPDGIVGPNTWTALGQKAFVTPPSATASAPTPASSAATTAPWMAVAEAELGIHEDSLPGQHNQRIIEYHKTTTLKATTDETPWCSAFVNWVMTKAGYRGTNSALARSWLDWGKALQTPQVGAITVIKRKGATSDSATGSATGFHVAFYVSSTPTHIRLLGGNQSDQVKYSNFSLQSYEVKGYRWPL